jgi:hypothetical protein
MLRKSHIARGAYIPSLGHEEVQCRLNEYAVYQEVRSQGLPIVSGFVQDEWAREGKYTASPELMYDYLEAHGINPDTGDDQPRIPHSDIAPGD